eukprot:gene17605-9246_t
MADTIWIILAIDVIPALFTVIGNAVFFITFLRTRSLHTPSNVLLWFLSLIDLVVGTVCQPLFIFTLFKEHGPCCTVAVKIYNIVFGLTCWNSLVCVALVTIDRFLAIFFPFQYKEKASCKTVACIFLFVFVVSSMYTVLVMIFYETARISFIIFDLVFQLLILALILAVYASIYRVMFRLMRSTQPQCRPNSKSVQQSQIVERKKTITLSMIIGAFLICYSPYIAYSVKSLLYYLGKTGFSSSFGMWANFFFLLKSSINPLIYCLRRNDIRQAACRAIKLHTPSSNLKSKETTF